MKLKISEQTELYKQFDNIIEAIAVFKKTLTSMHTETEWLTVREFAEIAGIKCKTVSNYCSNGLIKQCKKKNGRYLIHRSELQVRKEIMSSRSHTLMDHFLGNF